MAEDHSTNAKQVFRSKWLGLSPHLIAAFYEVERVQGPNGGLAYVPKPNGDEVHAPLVESNLDVSLGWASPFENVGSQNSAPTLQAMLQSGALLPIFDQLKTGNGGLIDKAAQKASETAQKFEGRTGVTKLNSTQVFTGMAPIKIQVSALFRAWSDPIQEVHDPFNRLMEWALPAELAEDGSMIGRTISAARGNKTATEVVFPSRTPALIALRYKGCTYAPLVIEGIAKPLNSPVDARGHHVELLVPMTLCSLTAIDHNDWGKWNDI